MVARPRSASSSICATRARGLTMDVRSRARSPSRCAKAKSRRPCTATPSLSTVGPHQLSFDVVPAGWAADAGASVALRVFAGDFLVNGSTIRSNTIERQYLDHAPVDYEYFTGQALNVLAVDAKQAAPATYTRPVPLGYTVSVGGYCYLPAKPTRWRRPLGPFSLGRGHAYGISRHLGASDWNSAQVSVTIGFNRSANCSDEIRRFFGSGEQQLSFPFGVEPNHRARPRICDVQGVSVGS